MSKKNNILDSVTRISRVVATKVTADTATGKESGTRGQPTLESPGTGHSGGDIHGFWDTVANLGGDILPFVNAWADTPASDPKPASAIEAPQTPSMMSGKTLWVLGGAAALVVAFFLFRRK